jgi:hypothetical protein
VVEEKVARAAAAAEMDTPFAFTSSAGGYSGSSTESAEELPFISLDEGDNGPVLPSRRPFLPSQVPSLISGLLAVAAAPCTGVPSVGVGVGVGLLPAGAGDSGGDSGVAVWTAIGVGVGLGAGAGEISEADVYWSCTSTGHQLLGQMSLKLQEMEKRKCLKIFPHTPTMNHQGWKVERSEITCGNLDPRTFSQ